jgi:hypothetical protein
MAKKIIINELANTNYLSGSNNEASLCCEMVKRAVIDCHTVVDKILDDIPVDVFSILGMRNLSAFIGELFAKSLESESNGLLKSNPHQDGYPDLLLLDKVGQELWNKLETKGELRAKAPFSPFDNGGIEVKATCGSVPSPKEAAKKGLEKPGMGDTRIDVLKGYDWKAHHRETNNLLGLLWDFDEKRSPRIIAVFFGNNLTENDWGKIVQPKEGGGRTTSVSIMPRASVKKMYDNWLLVLDDDRYKVFLNKYNKSDLIK